MNVRVVPPREPRVRGVLRPPSDKSVTQRALILAAVADGTSRLLDPLESRDTGATRDALVRLGARVRAVERGLEITGAERLRVDGEAPLDLQNSGTGARLLLGLLSGQGVRAAITGDASLRTRPMRRVVEPLAQMGALILGADLDRLPLVVEGGRELRPFLGELAVPSAQVKSAILLAALGAHGETRLGEPVPTRAHTESLLPRFGVAIETGAGERREIRLRGPQRPRAATLRIPADPSAAAFFGAAAALLPGSSIRLDDVLLDAHRTAFFALLERMGARVGRRESAAGASCEPSGAITVEHAPLRAVEVEPHEAAALIDELPLVAVLGAAASGVTRVRGAAELRLKESDRIEAIAAGLAGLGASVRTAPDGFEIVGPARLRGATVDARDDHRIAMALSIAALAAEGATIVRGFEAVDVSYPCFAADLGRCLGGSPFEPA